MHPYIKKLRSKPDHIKKSILAFALIVSMSLVSMVWFFSLGNRFNNKTAEKTREDIKPFSMLGDSISNAVKNISASVGNISVVKDKMIDTQTTTDTQTQDQVTN